jgi:hypothetical protein
VAGARRLLLVPAIAAVLAGCGGPITDDELQRGIESLGAAAAEGRLVALDAAEDRTKTTFVRVAARDLGDEVVHEAEKLSDAETRPDNGRTRDDAVTLAKAIDSALGDLQIAPTDRALAKRVADRLDALSSRADALTGRL